MSTPWIVLFVALWLVVVSLVIVVLGLHASVEQVRLQLRMKASPLSASPSPVPPDPLAGLPAAGSMLPAVPGHEDLTMTGAPRVLLFLGATCPPCAKLAIEMRDGLDHALATQSLGRVLISVITDELGSELYADVCNHIVTQPDGEISRALGVSVTPLGLAVGQDLIVSAARVPNRLEDVIELARSANAELPIVQAGA